ncbi:S1C family serine protease [Angustibacter sp. McL0619]|uniref:S1C family serine protease n=1 Tax=Angustibacter sp. McL0619 TaxID=3415676 RepID=UPI003CEC36DA
MKTSPEHSGASFLARRPTPAHRCKARRNRPLSAATLVLALGLTTVGGLVAGAPAASAAVSTAADSWQADSPFDWSWGDSQLGQSQLGQSQLGQSQLGTATTDTSDASAAASVGMVEITSELSDGTAAGTGMVLSSDGTVVTNHHVVEGATAIQVTVVSTGQTYRAQFVGADGEKDVAVLKLVGASGLDTVALSSTAARVGDSVTAVGDANGDGGSLTAAPGQVTDTGQSITVQGEDGSPHALSDLIQVNADVIPGDSGGALVDSDGKVVGMNVAASSGTADVQGFVIPISTVLSTARAIVAGDDSGAIQLGYTGYLGVGLYDGDAATVADTLDGSAAADAGLQQGDTITSVDGQQVGSASELRAAIAAHQAGARVRLTWTTADGQQESATVTLGQAPIA